MDTHSSLSLLPNCWIVRYPISSTNLGWTNHRLQTNLTPNWRDMSGLDQRERSSDVLWSLQWVISTDFNVERLWGSDCWGASSMKPWELGVSQAPWVPWVMLGLLHKNTQLGVSINGGIQNGWFGCHGKSHESGWFGGTPISGNHQFYQS